MLKGQKASIKMNAQNFKNMDWEIKVQFDLPNGKKGIETIGGFVSVETIGKDPNATLREYKERLLKCYNNYVSPAMKGKIISCNLKYITYAEARKRAERLYKEGKLAKEIADNFGLN